MDFSLKKQTIPVNKQSYMKIRIVNLWIKKSVRNLFALRNAKTYLSKFLNSVIVASKIFCIKYILLCKFKRSISLIKSTLYLWRYANICNP